MKNIKDFYDWLFRHDTEPAFPILFVVGAFLVAFTLVVLLLAFAPILAAGFALLMFFGVPIVAYLLQRSGGGE